jgi:hypothetical protein
MATLVNVETVINVASGAVDGVKAIDDYNAVIDSTQDAKVARDAGLEQA